MNEGLVSRRGISGILIVLAATAAGFGCRSSTEIPKSQYARLTQHVGGSVVTIEYNRPVARGRRLFGGIVAFGEPWNPGADAASTVTLSRDTEWEGRPVPKGTYSIWVIPGADRWTFILSRAADVFHVPYPEGEDALRLSLQPRAGMHMETLSFYFPMVDADSAYLHLHWGETLVPIRIWAR